MVNSERILFSLITGIKLRERTAPLKYTVDKDLETSSSEDEGDEPFPREKCTIDSWVNEVNY